MGLAPTINSLLYIINIKYIKVLHYIGFSLKLIFNSNSKKICMGLAPFMTPPYYDKNAYLAILRFTIFP